VAETPTTEQIRDAWGLGRGMGGTATVAEGFAEFDRWFAEKKADVWDECLTAIESNNLNTEQARKGNPYRPVADDRRCRYCGHTIVWTETGGWLRHDLGTILWNTALCSSREANPDAGHAL